MGSRVLGVVGSGSGGLEELLPRLIRAAQAAGWTVVVTLTPTVGRWLRESGTFAAIEPTRTCTTTAATVGPYSSWPATRSPQRWRTYRGCHAHHHQCPDPAEGTP